MSFCNSEEHEILQNLFHGKVEDMGTFLGANKARKFCRNSHRLFRIKGSFISVKKFKEKSKVKNETIAYNLLAQKHLAITPKLYYSDDKFLITEFIKPSAVFNLKETIKDWGNVHSETIIFQNSDTLLDSFFIHKSNIAENLPQKLRKIVNLKLFHSPKRNISSFIHGDLYSNNVLNNGQNNYYIDFEGSRYGHPCQDLSLLLFNNHEQFEEIKQDYLEAITFVYPGIENDIDYFFLIKLLNIINGLKKDSHLPKEFRLKYSKKAMESIERLICSTNI